MKQRRLLALDGARGFAAACILVFHVSGPQIPAFSHLHIAVDFFFVLSGFVLAPAVSRINSLSGALVFLRSRFLRVFPMVFAIIVYTVLYDLAIILKHWIYGQPTTPSIILSIPTLVASLLLLQIFYEPAQLVNYPVWSLSAEWVANILLAAMSVFTKKGKYFSLLMGAFMIVVSHNFGIGSMNQLGRAIWGFSIGLILFDLQRAFLRKKRFMILCTMSLVPLYLVFEKFEGYDCFVFVWPFCALILSLAQLDTPERFFTLFSFMGRYSYGFYLWHFPMLSLSSYLLKTLGGGISIFENILSLILVASVLSVFATKASLFLFEEPIRTHWK